MAQRLRHVDAPAFGQRRAQAPQVAHHHGRLVEVDGLERQALHASGSSSARVNMRSRMARRRARRAVPGRPPGPRRSARSCWSGAGGQHHGRQPRSAHTCPRRAGRPRRRSSAITASLAAQPEAELPQARLLLLDQPCHRDGRAHVGKRVVRGLRGPGRWRRSGVQLEAGTTRRRSSATRCPPGRSALAWHAPRRAGPSGRSRSATRAHRGR